MEGEMKLEKKKKRKESKGFYRTSQKNKNNKYFP